MKRAAVSIATTYFILMAAAITFPGLGLVNRIRPMILGIPFVFAWVLLWVAASIAVFYLLYRAFDT